MAGGRRSGDHGRRRSRASDACSCRDDAGTSRREADTGIRSTKDEALGREIATRILAVAIDCSTLLTTETNARVPALLDLRQTLPASETRPQRSVLSMSLARLKDPLAGYTPPEEAIERLKAKAA